MGNKKLRWLILAAVIFVVLALIFGGPLKKIAETIRYNFEIGTYATEENNGEMSNVKRNIAWQNYNIQVPPKWTVFKDFPKKGHLYFDLHSAETDLTLNLYQLTVSSQKETQNTIQELLSSIKPLADKRAAQSDKVITFNNIEWKCFWNVDKVLIGKRLTGFYYSQLSEDSVQIIYFFSMAEEYERIFDILSKFLSSYKGTERTGPGPTGKG